MKQEMSTPQPRPAQQRSVELTETLTGSIVRVSFYNPDTGYTVAQVQTAGQSIPIVGKLPNVQPGEAVQLEGQWMTHPVYGRQFRVSHAKLSRPDTVEAIQRYLGSGLIHGLGPVLAERLVAHFGPAVLDVLDQTPQRVTEVARIGKKRAEWLGEAWKGIGRCAASSPGWRPMT